MTMEAHHVPILAALQGGDYHLVDQIVETTGLTAPRVRAALVKLYWGGLVASRGRAKRNEENDEWRLSAEGGRVVEAMRKHFKGG